MIRAHGSTKGFSRVDALIRSARTIRSRPLNPPQRPIEFVRPGNARGVRRCAG